MKKLFLLAAFFTLSNCILAQPATIQRKIEVNGVAEQEVTPDIINVSVSLKEYVDGRKKVTISELEKQLQQAVTNGGINAEDFTIQNLYSYNYNDRKKKDEDFLSKQYTIRFHDLKNINDILSQVDPKGIESTSIASYDYSKMTDLKRELKIQALLAAKNKAIYLLASIGEKLGNVIEINEIGDSNLSAYFNTAATANSVTFYNKGDNNDNADINFKKIKLSFQINATFEIVK